MEVDAGATRGWVGTGPHLSSSTMTQFESESKSNSCAGHARIQRARRLATTGRFGLKLGSGVCVSALGSHSGTRRKGLQSELEALVVSVGWVSSHTGRQRRVGERIPLERGCDRREILHSRNMRSTKDEWDETEKPEVVSTVR